MENSCYFSFSANSTCRSTKVAGKQENSFQLKAILKTKEKKKQEGLFCIIHYSGEKHIRPLTELSFEILKNQLRFVKAKERETMVYTDGVIRILPTFYIHLET